MDTLQELFEDQLMDIYYAEKQIVKALPKMAKAASYSELQRAFEGHLKETEEHIYRLERVFDLIGVPVKGKKCEAIEGIIEEGNEFIKNKNKFDPDVLDAGLIASAQRVEHYEIAVYGTLRTFAKRIGQNMAAAIFDKTLDEEKNADKKLTAIAVKNVNERAAKP